MKFAREIRVPVGAACQACTVWGTRAPPPEVPVRFGAFRACRRPRQLAFSGEVTAYGQTLYTHPNGRCADFQKGASPT